ncbi:MAG: patatin family protein [Coriobacteriales bacterium]|nr:patatin family protein [Coriobacteriales bacterium]
MGKGSCLVLEGGAMRCSFTAGVLDHMMIARIPYPDAIVGVSAGNLVASSYLSGQIGRSIRINCTYCDDSRMASLRSMRRSGSFVDPDFLYHKVQEELDPCDFEALAANPCELTVVCTDVETGGPRYFKIDDMRKQIDVVRASASLPLVSRPVEYGGYKLLDGGVADSIPLQWALDQGFERIVVILTRDHAYSKEPESRMLLARRMHSSFPPLLKAMEERYIMYNAERELCFRLQEEGRIVLIEPPVPVTIPQMEKDASKLVALYNQGLAVAREHEQEIRAALS